MRCTTVLLCAVLAGCSVRADPPPPRHKAEPPKPGLAATISLPADDGRVHVIDVPGRYEMARCLVHVVGQSSTIACLPPTEPLPAVPER